MPQSHNIVYTLQVQLIFVLFTPPNKMCSCMHNADIPPPPISYCNNTLTQPIVQADTRPHAPMNTSIKVLQGVSIPTMET